MKYLALLGSLIFMGSGIKGLIDYYTSYEFSYYVPKYFSWLYDSIGFLSAVIIQIVVMLCASAWFVWLIVKDFRAKKVRD